MGVFKLEIGNIMNYLDNAGAVINSANRYMVTGSGVCGLIYKEASARELERFCKSRYSKNMRVNEVRITPGFNLGMDIIHIYAPKFLETKSPLIELLESYTAIFKEAKFNNYNNLVSTSIATGMHGYKHEEIAASVTKHIKELVEKYDINFTLVLVDQNIKKLYEI